MGVSCFDGGALRCPSLPSERGRTDGDPLEEGVTIPYTDPRKGDPLGELPGFPSKDSGGAVDAIRSFPAGVEAVLART